MRTIDINKLSKEMNDALIHREAVMRSGRYLAQYLIKHNRNLDAIRLIGRCSVHDISKIQNTEEFMSLASIVDNMSEMHNIEYVPNEDLKNAIKLHHQNNRHHPEYYDSPNDMSDLDLLEMACDCHARSKQFKSNLIDYIDAQQILRFKFDRDHFNRLKMYCLALQVMSKNDDYSDIFNQDNNIMFAMKDATMESLEKFNDSDYSPSLKTDRLILLKYNNPDFASVVYNIFLRDTNDEIGNISIKCDGTVEYKIYLAYKNRGYLEEAIRKIVEVSTLQELKLNIRNDNLSDMSIATSIGFEENGVNESRTSFVLKKVKRA